MEQAPGRFEGAQPFHLEFGIHETKESTKEAPVLRYTRNGFSFIATLNLFKNSIDIQLDERRPESLERDWKPLLSEVQALATEELQTRKEQYGEEHFS